MKICRSSKHKQVCEHKDYKKPDPLTLPGPLADRTTLNGRRGSTAEKPPYTRTDRRRNKVQQILLPQWHHLSLQFCLALDVYGLTAYSFRLFRRFVLAGDFAFAWAGFGSGFTFRISVTASENFSGRNDSGRLLFDI